ncbi:MAG: M56 family metallopeptidase [Solirubrobacteraceae bacterium]
MTETLSLLALAAIAVPHALALDEVRPSVAAAMWLAALMLRAVIALFVAVFAIFYLPASATFAALTHWCWAEVLPLITTHLHLALNGHDLGNVATLAPSLALTLLALWTLIAASRAARTIGRSVRRAGIGSGPNGSVIVAGPDVVLAAAGIAAPRVVVSAGALAVLDDHELAAGLEHERAHIVRRHRYFLLVAELCRSIGRIVPGSRRAIRELSFHLERDADQWALQRTHDPLALASAICKAAAPSNEPALVALAGSAGPRRVSQLLEGVRPGASGHGPMTLVATIMVTLAVALGALVPSTASAGLHRLSADTGAHQCRA